MPAFPFLLTRAVADPDPQRAVNPLESEPDSELKRTGIEVVDLVFELAEVPRIPRSQAARQCHPPSSAVPCAGLLISPAMAPELKAAEA